MKSPYFVPFMLTSILLGSTASAQVDDWQAVKALPPETRIEVTLKHGHGSKRCTFKEATDEDLTCAVEHQGPVIFRRDNVRAVYLKREHNHIGAPPIVVVPAVFVPVVIIAVFAGPVPVVVGAGVIGGTYLLTNHFVHGKTIYQSASRPGCSRPAADSG